MDLLINGEKIDFYIEGEKTILDIYENLVVDIKNFGKELAITSIKVDGKDIELSGKILGSIPIKDVKFIEFEIIDQESIAIQFYIDALDKIKLILDTPDDVVIKEQNTVIDTFENINLGFKSTTSFFKILSKYIEPEMGGLEGLIKKFDTIVSLKDDYSVEYSTHIKPLLIQFYEDLSKAIQSFSLDIDKYFKDILTVIKEVKKDIVSVPEMMDDLAVSMQTGEKYEENISRFIDKINAYINFLKMARNIHNLNFASFIVNDKSLLEHIKQLRELLFEITEFLQENDTISLSDLIEYEFVPEFENALKYLELLENHFK